ncbi:MAG: zf-HC2 domain-containing protein [Bacteroidales bacterium]|nr:zf-HC2 domain-containing protein [Bacteroidales bacterium]
MRRCAKKYNYFAYLEGTLASSERLALEEHLSVCAECQENLFVVKEMFDKIEEAKTLTPSPYVFSQIMGRIEQNRIVESRYRKWQPAIIGIVSLLAIVIGMLVGNYYFKNTAQYASYLHMNDVQQEVIELSLLDNY